MSSLINGSNKNNLICQEIPRWRKYNPEIHQGMTETYFKEAENLGKEPEETPGATKLTGMQRLRAEFLGPKKPKKPQKPNKKNRSNPSRRTTSNCRIA